MNLTEQVDAFDAELRNLVNRYVEEFDLPEYAMLGIIESVKLDMVTPEISIELERMGFEEEEEENEDEDEHQS